MKNSKWLTGVVAALALAGSFSGADVISDQLRFRQIFLNEVRALNPSATPENIEPLHSVSDATVERMLQAGSIDEAMGQLGKTNVLNLISATKGFADQKITAEAPSVRSAPLTIVLVPGVFAEFIQNRAFEEIFEKKDSKFRDEFKKLVTASGASDSVQLIHNYRENRPKTEIAKNEIRTLDQVINVGDMNINGTQVKVILFFTEFATLESLGADQDRAEIFIRRLEKYLALTGPQDLAFIGYSRGTPLALEMLAQAQAANRPWVKDVKAMISLSGVVWGSSLADSAFYDKSTPGNKILTDLPATVASLNLVDEKTSFFTSANLSIVRANAKKWEDFGLRTIENYRAMDVEKSKVKSVSALRALIQTDPRTPLGIVVKLWSELGLVNPRTEYNQNIARFGYFVNQLLASVKGLTTASRTAWWAEHDIPLNPIYYAIPAAMVNPDAGPVELALFKNPLAYGGNGNYDDVSLVQNTLDYVKITRANTDGVTLNDSQVAVAQSAFLPNVIANLRPSNSTVKTKFLGIAGTHHWGMALRVVNKKMFSLTGGQNGFPREALLRALATQVMLDNP